MEFLEELKTDFNFTIHIIGIDGNNTLETFLLGKRKNGLSAKNME